MAGAAGIVLWQAQSVDTTDQTGAVPMHRAYFLEKSFYDQAYDEATVTRANGSVIGGIVPHHLLAASIMAGFYAGLEQQSPSTVVIIGPNHLNLGDAPVIVSAGDWETPYGTIKPASSVVNALVEAKVATVDERLFATEHSISAEAAFVKKSFPEATVVPIALRTFVTPLLVTKLVETLDQALPPDALVIASVDFAHYVPSSVADQQDARSLDRLQRFALDEVSAMDVDSPVTVSAFLQFLNRRQARTPQLLINSNSAKLTGQLDIPEVTSYITMYYSVSQGQ